MARTPNLVKRRKMFCSIRGGTTILQCSGAGAHLYRDMDLFPIPYSLLSILFNLNSDQSCYYYYYYQSH